MTERAFAGLELDEARGRGEGLAGELAAGRVCRARDEVAESVGRASQHGPHLFEEDADQRVEGRRELVFRKPLGFVRRRGARNESALRIEGVELLSIGPRIERAFPVRPLDPLRDEGEVRAESEARDRVAIEVGVERTEQAVVAEAGSPAEDVVVNVEVGFEDLEHAMLAGLPGAFGSFVAAEVDESGVDALRLVPGVGDAEGSLEESRARLSPGESVRVGGHDRAPLLFVELAVVGLAAVLAEVPALPEGGDDDPLVR